MNSQKEICGFGKQIGKNYLLFFDLVACGKMGPGVFLKGFPTSQICVSECPLENWSFLSASNDIHKLKYCKPGVNLTKSVTTLLKDEDCPFYLLASKPSKAYGLFLKSKEYGEKVIQDVIASWWMIVVGYILAMCTSLLWIVLMRWLAGVMVWIAIILFVAVFVFSSYWCLSSYIHVKGKEDAFHLAMMSLQFSFSKENFYLGFGRVSVVVLAIVLLILLFLVHRIRIAVSLINEGSRAVGSMLMTLIFPVGTFALQIAVIAYWLITLCKMCGVINNAQEGQYTIYLQVFNLFMLFWLVNFVIAIGEMTLAGAFASYYWAFNKPKDIPTFPLLSSLGCCFRYHLGTLAFGSLLVAIIQIIRLFLEYLDHKLKGSENPVAKFLLKCLKCCFWCLEKFIRFLNKNAYIMVAIDGKNFCSSARSAFMLIMRNVVRVFVVDKVTGFLLFIGKLLVVGSVASASYFFFNGDISFLQNYQPSLNFYVVPIVLVTVGSYVVASCFFNVYSMAVDTLFLCFLEDLEHNDGT